MKKIIFILVLFATCIFTYAANNASLYAGQTTIFSAPNPPSDAAINQVAWSSSCADLAVEKYGNTGCKIKVLSYFTGNAEIRCDYYYFWYDKNGFMHTNNATTYYYVSCIPVNINLQSTNIKLNVGEKKKISYSYSPSNVNPKPSINFISNNTNIATVDNDGYVYAKSSGSTTITIENSSGPNATCYIDVESIDPTGISLPSYADIELEQQKQLIASISPTGATTDLTWWSEDKNVATVNNNGYVTGTSVGETKIWVKALIGGYTDFCNVKVFEPSLSLKSCIPNDGESSVNTETKIAIEFSHPIYKDIDFNKISLQHNEKEHEGNTTIEGNKVVFTPNKELNSNTEYTFTIPKTALKNKWGTQYKEDIIINFKTAIRSNDVKWLIWHKGKVKVAFGLCLRPQLTISDNGTNFTIKENNNSVSNYTIEDNIKFTIGCDNDLSSAIQAISSNKEEGHIENYGVYVLLSEFGANTPVKLYTSNGVLIESLKTNCNGICYIPMSKYHKGIYVIKVNKTKLKFLKQ